MCEKFLPIRVKTLKSDVSLGFELFLKLPHKFILYFDAQDGIDDSRLIGLKDKNVRKLFIRDIDEPLYQNFIDKALNKVLNDKDADITQKAQLISSVSEDACEQIFEGPVSKKSYQKAQETTQKLTNYLLKNDQLLQNMLIQELDSDEESSDALMYKHSINSASLTISFCDYFGLDKDTIHNMGLAAIYHDIAYTQLDDKGKELFFKSIISMNTDEAKLYREHPKIACEIIQDKDFATLEFLELIMKHEERSSGNGFPKGEKKLTYEQEVFNLCIYYDRQITILKRTPKEVKQELKENLEKNFTKELIAQFLKFLG